MHEDAYAKEQNDSINVMLPTSEYLRRNNYGD
jgi:hypothetical protein